jgi:hypothetical protein
MEKNEIPEWVMVIAFSPVAGAGAKYRFLTDPTGNNIVLAWGCKGMRGDGAPPPEAVGKVISWLNNGGEKLIKETGVNNDGWVITPMVRPREALLTDLGGSSKPNVFIHWEPEIGSLTAPADRRIRVK